jgi:hypothetical protein
MKIFTLLKNSFSRVVAWVELPVFVMGSGYSLWLGIQLGQPITIDGFLFTLGFGSFAAVGSLLVARCPSNLVSWFMVTIGLVGGLFPTADAYAAYILTTQGTPNLLAVFCAWLNQIYWIPLLGLALIYLPLLFPDGHLPSRRWLPVTILASLAVVGALVINAFSETLNGQIIDYQITNPIGIKGLGSAVDTSFFPFLVIGLLVGLFSAVASLIVRFIHSKGAERQQIKWFLFAVALIPLMITTNYLPNIFGAFVVGVILVCLSTAIGVAVLRYHLYDIDLIIRRTLQYSILTGLLVLVYFGGIVLLQSIIRSLTGDVSQVAIVISTLGIAALFNPLRHRSQDFVDRRFYRSKYDAARVLSAFAQTARDEVEMNRLSGALLEIVVDAMQPEKASLWLRDSKDTVL